MIEGGPGYLFGMSKLKKINMILKKPYKKQTLHPGTLVFD